MCIYSKELWEKTITAWQPLSSSVLSEQDTEEITGNIIGLFSLLSEWEKKDDEQSLTHHLLYTVALISIVGGSVAALLSLLLK